MDNTKIIQETTKKLSKLVDKSRYSKNISYRLKNQRNNDRNGYRIDIIIVTY